jgi:hypothetical protein
MMQGQYTIGCDPEYFLMEEGRFVSSIPFCEGTKDEPVALPNGGFVMRDNVAVEFGITPAKTVNQWVNNINTTLEDMKNYLPDNLKLVAVPSANFPRKELLHDEAKKFGCDPDYNAWSGEKNTPPDDCTTSTFRSCGGHIHIGYVKDSGNDFLLDKYGRLRVIRTMDCFHGMVSTLLDNSPEAIARRNLYGKAGCFRRTDYGVEYRTLSNFWCQTDSLKRLMYYLTDDVLTVVRESDDEYVIELCGGADRVQTIINTGDVKAAKLNVALLREQISVHSLQTLDEYLKERKGIKDAA